MTLRLWAYATKEWRYHLLGWKRLLEEQVLGDGTNLNVQFGRFFCVGIVCHQIKLEKQDPPEKGGVVC